MATHLSNSLTYFNRFNLSQLFEYIFTYRFYPPLVYWNASIYLSLFGFSIPTAILSNFTFLLILSYSTYELGKEFWSKSVGLLATVFLLATPMFVSQFKEFQIDAPLSAMVALALVLLIKTREFSSEKRSIVFGIVFGLGLLTKWTFLLFMILPLFTALFLTLRSVINKKRELFRVRNAIFSGLVAYLVSGFWYLSNLRNLRIDVVASLQSGIKEGDPLVGSLESNLYYFFNLINSQLYLVPVLFFLTGLFFLYYKRDAINLRKNLYLLTFIFGAVLIFTFLRNKDARYTLPILSAVAVVSTFWLNFLKEKQRLVLSILLIGYSILTFLAVSFGLSFLPKNVIVDLNEKNKLVLFAQNGYLIGPPTRENWYLVEAIEYIKKTPNSSFAFEGLDTIWFNKSALSFYAQKGQLRFVSNSQEADLLLIRNGEEINCPSERVETKTFLLPDGTKLKICK